MPTYRDKLDRIQVVSDGGITHVYVNGVELTTLSRIEIDCEAMELPQVILTLYADIDFVGETTAENVEFKVIEK